VTVEGLKSSKLDKINYLEDIEENDNEEYDIYIEDDDIYIEDDNDNEDDDIYIEEDDDNDNDNEDDDILNDKSLKQNLAHR